ncbi:MAG: peptide chain release factor 1 [Verrucomicrobia bacterium RIFCSPHIGHO2_12_FULL_41_10]|nr:MAG: peptide chain release factor 1 [Verrucomicrobia bacterium RIFCSPHIGHO2_12_FULL_41_10]HLB33709.1 peptide chain release factor 1 [Chthoniobacterales bacterium]
MSIDFTQLIHQRRERFAVLEEEITSPTLYADAKHARDVLQEHARLKELLTTANQLELTRRHLRENQVLAHGSDVELAEMAAAEIIELEQQAIQLEQALQISLLPPQPDDDRDAIVEVRAGTGGSEAGLFATDLYRMYCRYAEAHGLKVELIEGSFGELGGYKEVIFQVSGEQVFRKLRFESGVHRVQRVPATETQGRIHTSTATVAVLPEADEVDVVLRPQDLRIEVCRSGGPGGQGVNTTDSAVQIMHLPTGKIVRCQDGRSQQKNKEKALQILRARLLEEKRAEEEQKYSEHRRSQIGTGGREEKIRTYNFPQNRLTDHRIGLTLYNLDRIMEGELDELISVLETKDLQRRLEESAEVKSK